MYLKLYCLCWVTAYTLAAPLTDEVPPERQQPTVIPILSLSAEYEPDGKFKYSYETANGIKREETAYDKEAPEGKSHSNCSNEGGEDDDSGEIHVQKGSYSYTAPDGSLVSVRYIADENGFQPINERIQFRPDTKSNSEQFSLGKPLPSSNEFTTRQPVTSERPELKRKAHKLKFGDKLINKNDTTSEKPISSSQNRDENKGAVPQPTVNASTQPANAEKNNSSSMPTNSNENYASDNHKPKKMNHFNDIKTTTEKYTDEEKPARKSKNLMAEGQKPTDELNKSPESNHTDTGFKSLPSKPIITNGNITSTRDNKLKNKPLSKDDTNIKNTSIEANMSDNKKLIPNTKEEKPTNKQIKPMTGVQKSPNNNKNITKPSMSSQETHPSKEKSKDTKESNIHKPIINDTKPKEKNITLSANKKEKSKDANEANPKDTLKLKNQDVPISENGEMSNKGNKSIKNNLNKTNNNGHQVASTDIEPVKEKAKPTNKTEPKSINTENSVEKIASSEKKEDKPVETAKEPKPEGVQKSNNESIKNPSPSTASKEHKIDLKHSNPVDKSNNSAKTPQMPHKNKHDTNKEKLVNKSNSNPTESSIDKISLNENKPPNKSVKYKNITMSGMNLDKHSNEPKKNETVSPEKDINTKKPLNGDEGKPESKKENAEKNGHKLTTPVKKPSAHAKLSNDEQEAPGDKPKNNTVIPGKTKEISGKPSNNNQNSEKRTENPSYSKDISDGNTGKPITKEGAPRKTKHITDNKRDKETENTEKPDEKTEKTDNNSTKNDGKFDNKKEKPVPKGENPIENKVSIDKNKKKPVKKLKNPNNDENSPPMQEKKDTKQEGIPSIKGKKNDTSTETPETKPKNVTVKAKEQEKEAKHAADTAIEAAGVAENAAEKAVKAANVAENAADTAKMAAKETEKLAKALSEPKGQSRELAIQTAKEHAILAGQAAKEAEDAAEKADKAAEDAKKAAKVAENIVQSVQSASSLENAQKLAEKSSDVVQDAENSAKEAGNAAEDAKKQLGVTKYQSQKDDKNPK